MLIALLVALLVVAGVPRLRSRLGRSRWAGRSARVGPSDEVDLLNGLAAELRAGASLRMALVAATDRAPLLDLDRAARMATAGLPAADLADEIARALPVNGRFVAAAFRLAATSGGRAAAMFEELALRAAEAGELSRERRSLTAQARLSALVVGGAPLVLGVILLITGRARAFFAAGRIGLVVALLGLGLQVAGLVTVTVILRRAERAS